MAPSAYEIENKNKKWYFIGYGLVIIFIHLIILLSPDAYQFKTINATLWIIIDVILVILFVLRGCKYLADTKAGGADNIVAASPWLLTLVIALWVLIFNYWHV